MAIEAGQKYDAEVLAIKATEARDGKPGIWVNFQALDAAGVAAGMISKTIWLTPANRDQARKSLKALGATELEVTTKAGFRELLENLSSRLSGAECSITTEASEYQGKTRVEVKWINSRVKAASAAAIDRAESLFDDGGAGDSDGDPGPHDDNEVPY